MARSIASIDPTMAIADDMDFEDFLSLQASKAPLKLSLIWSSTEYVRYLSSRTWEQKKILAKWNYRNDEFLLPS